MIRRLWLVCCVLIPLYLASIPACVLAAIWAESSRMGDTAILLFFCGIPITFGFAFWTSEYPTDPNLPRRHRKALRAEQDRIRLEVAIRDAEREAGIR